MYYEQFDRTLSHRVVMENSSKFHKLGKFINVVKFANFEFVLRSRHSHLTVVAFSSPENLKPTSTVSRYDKVDGDTRD